MIAGKSTAVIEPMAYWPMPGQPNTTSTTSVPPSRYPNWTPNAVTTGISAFRSACRTSTARSRSPLARAVRT